MLINLVNVFLIVLFILEEKFNTKSVLFLFALYLILIIPLVYYIKRKHYICASVIGADILINYIILIYFTVLSFTNASNSNNMLLLPCVYGVIVNSICILPILFIKYKKEYITL